MRSGPASSKRWCGSPPLFSLPPRIAPPPPPPENRPGHVGRPDRLVLRAPRAGDRNYRQHREPPEQGDPWVSRRVDDRGRERGGPKLGLLDRTLGLRLGAEEARL